jgi:S-adenosylmethionine-diacylgycerolhomoserine-N-methlytransferase
VSDAATTMDGMYRWQRHIYDASRKYYLLGRDAMIADLRPPPGGSVLEIGCGTGRNLVRAAQAYPDVACYGLDVSAEMLVTARRSVARAGLSRRVTLAVADATAFQAEALFGRASFERIFISYALSMIPQWEAVLDRAVEALAPGGSLHLVDFGDQAGLPGWFRFGLNRWLGWFHVVPRRNLNDRLRILARARGLRLTTTTRLAGYAAQAVLERPIVRVPQVPAAREATPGA